MAAYRFAEGPAASRRGWQPPEVSDGRGRRHACGSREVIKLPRWARTAPVVLHECAHGLADDMHGPNFLRAYLELIEHFLGADRLTLLTSARAARLVVAARPGGPVGRR